MDQDIGDPDTQTVDQDDAGRAVGGVYGLWQVNRGLDKLPVRAAPLLMKGDPRFHLGIEDFRGGDIDRPVAGGLGKTFGMCRFAGPRPA